MNALLRATLLARRSGSSRDAFRAGLDERERDVFDHRIGSDERETLREIAERWGVSHARISQVERKLRAALARLEKGVA